MLILYLATSLNLQISSNIFLVLSSGFSCVWSCHLLTGSFTSSFPVWMLFLPFSWLMGLARTSTVLQRRGKSKHLHLSLVLVGKLSLLSSVICGLVTDSLCRGTFLLYLIQQSFYHDWVLDFVVCFFCVTEMIMWLLSIILLTDVSHLLICICWAILVFQAGAPLDHGAWSFLCAI